MTRSGGQVLVDQLVLHGADLAFGVPGESYLAVLDALHDAPLRLVVTRHESGAANMAEAYGKLTGRPGICMVTRGPGATNASNGVHTAMQDSTPLLLLVGQIARETIGREAFQELDYRAVFGSMAKWVTQIDRAERVPELIARAFAVATSGRPGPVVVALPEDMLASEVDVPDAAPHRPLAGLAPADGDIARLGELLAQARAPLAIVGEGGWTAQTGADVAAFAEAQAVPVAASFRCQDYVDNASPAYAGHAGLGMDPALARRIREADVLLAIGGRLGEIPTAGYTLVRPGAPTQRLVHVHPDPDEIGAVYPTELGIAAGLEAFAAAARRLEPSGRRGRAPGLLEAAHGEYERNLRRDARAARAAADVRGDGDAARAPARRGDPHQRRRQLQRVGAPLLRVPPLPDAAGPAQRLDGLRRPRRGRRQGRAPRPPGRVHRRRRRLPHDRPGARVPRSRRSCPSSCSWSTTACTGRSACTRSATTPAASSAPTCATPTSSPTRAPSAPTGRWSSAPRTSPPPSTRRSDCGRPALIELRVDPQAITPRQTLDEIRAAAS